MELPLCLQPPQAGLEPEPPARSLLTESDYIWVRSLLTRRFARAAQEPGSNVPMLPSIGDDRNRLLVVPGQHAYRERSAFRLELHAIADAEFKHLRMRAHLMQEPQAFNNPIVEVDQFCFSEFIDIKLHTDLNLYQTSIPTCSLFAAQRLKSAAVSAVLWIFLLGN